jgi:hypothetical protein
VSEDGVCQRWRQRRELYRPAGEPIETRLYEVAEIADDTSAKRFVVEHHYSGSFPAARFRFGLYRGQELVGVAVFSHPCNDRVLTGVFPIEATSSTELGRLVLLDEVPSNGESWFIARCFELLVGRVAGVVSYSDPVARTRSDGTVVHPGHVGTIYQATNGVYLGRSKRRPLLLLPDGTVFSERALQKIRKRERGWLHSAGVLEKFGASRLELGDSGLWLAEWLPRLTRVLRHPGNYRYGWALDRSLRKGLAGMSAGSYPKLRDQPLAIGRAA